MDFKYHRPAPAPALNPAPQYAGMPHQPPYQAPQPQANPHVPPQPPPPQHPVAVGAQANPPAGSSGGPRWQTAALWIAGVIASTTIAYFVTKGLRANDERRAQNKAEKEGAANDPGPKFVLPNDGSVGEAVTTLTREHGRLAERMADVEHFITTTNKRGALRDAS